MIKFLKRLMALKGSWEWAVKKMDAGYIVRRSTDTGAAHYKLDHEGQRRIVWCFSRSPENLLCKQWQSANIFLSDFECVDWEVTK